METLAPLVFFALIGLIQLLVRWVRTMQQQQQQREQQQRPEPVEPRDTVPLPPIELPTPTRATLPVPAPRRLIDNRVPDDEELLVRTPARPASSAPPRRAARRRVHPRVGSRADVRRAFVLMEIFGPPRAAMDTDARRGR